MRIKRWFSALLLSAVAWGGQATTPGSHSQIVEAVRSYVLGYVRSLPDYTCVQVIHRETTQMRSTVSDVIEEEVSYIAGHEHYRVTKVNGFRAAITSQAQLGDRVGGMVSTGEYGSLLQQIFHPATGTTFRPAPSVKLRGRAVNVLTYHVPQSQGYRVYDREIGRSFLVAYEGSVFADAKTNSVMRFTMKCLNLPLETRLTAVDLAMDYRLTRLADQEFVLPFHFQLRSHRLPPYGRPIPEEEINSVDFTRYRRFTAESTVNFGDEAGNPKQ